jgi:hypothetical protein
MVVEGCAAGTSSPNFNHWQPISKPYFPVKNASKKGEHQTKAPTLISRSRTQAKRESTKQKPPPLFPAQERERK